MSVYCSRCSRRTSYVLLSSREHRRGAVRRGAALGGSPVVQAGELELTGKKRGTVLNQAHFHWNTLKFRNSAIVTFLSFEIACCKTRPVENVLEEHTLLTRWSDETSPRRLSSFHDSNQAVDAPRISLVLLPIDGSDRSSE